jgi:hypothetical protein
MDAISSKVESGTGIRLFFLDHLRRGATLRPLSSDQAAQSVIHAARFRRGFFSSRTPIKKPARES